MLSSTRSLRICGLALAALTGLLAGCSGSRPVVTADTFKPYVPEVVQGNFVSREQRQALRLGMNRAQVRDILGTPLLTSVFHADRWEYAFSIRRQGLPPQAFRLTVYFKGDQLVEIDNDELPSESEFVGRLAGRQNLGKPPVLQLSDEELRRLPVRPPAEVPPPPALPRSYPPLESPAR
jgi:outer membrane protein assembly factor BamE